jgi:hypothetical protein
MRVSYLAMFGSLLMITACTGEQLPISPTVAAVPTRAIFTTRSPNAFLPTLTSPAPTVMPLPQPTKVAKLRSPYWFSFTRQQELVYIGVDGERIYNLSTSQSQPSAPSIANLPTPEGARFQSHFSPSGRWVLYYRPPVGYVTPEPDKWTYTDYDLWLADTRDHTERSILPSGPFVGEVSVTWAADESWAFLSSPMLGDGGTCGYAVLIKLPDQTILNLLRASSNAASSICLIDAAISRTGHYIAVNKGRGVIDILDWQMNQKRSIQGWVYNLYNAFHWNESIDLLYYSTAAGIARYDPVSDNSFPVLALGDQESKVLQYNWRISPDERFLAFISSNGELWVLPLTTSSKN